MPITARERRRHPRNRFRVEVEGLGSADFMTCSALQANVEVIEHREGGRLTPELTAGNVSFEPITLARGAASGDNELYAWFQTVYEAGADRGLDAPNYKRTVDIIQLARSGGEERRWRLSKCWPSNFVAGEWDNDANENVVESVTLQFEDFDRVPGSE